jgi:hypothetical protein
MLPARQIKAREGSAKAAEILASLEVFFISS